MIINKILFHILNYSFIYSNNKFHSSLTCCTQFNKIFWMPCIFHPFHCPLLIFCLRFEKQKFNHRSNCLRFVNGRENVIRENEMTLDPNLRMKICPKSNQYYVLEFFFVLFLSLVFKQMCDRFYDFIMCYIVTLKIGL